MSRLSSDFETVLGSSTFVKSSFLPAIATMFAICFLAGTMTEANAQRDAPQRSKPDSAMIFMTDGALHDARIGNLDKSIYKLQQALKRRRPLIDRADDKPLPAEAFDIYAESRVYALAGFQTQLAMILNDLNSQWIEKGVDPQTAYPMWKELVFPADRPDEAFVYSTVNRHRDFDVNAPIDLDFPQPEIGDTAVGALVDWAIRADELDDLLAEAQRRTAHPISSEVALLLQIIIAGQEGSTVIDPQSLCDSLLSKPRRLVWGFYSEILCAHAWQLASGEGLRPESRDRLVSAVLVGARALSRNRSLRVWSENRWLQFFAAIELQKAIRNGDASRFKLIKGIAMTRYASIKALNPQLVEQNEQSLIMEADRRARDAGHPPFIHD